jgi:uncharacterized membrane protein
LCFGPWWAFRHAMAAADLPAAAAAQAGIRRIVTINLVLGLFTTAVGATGGLWAY